MYGHKYSNDEKDLRYAGFRGLPDVGFFWGKGPEEVN
jgi:hypothetical protein